MSKILAARLCADIDAPFVVFLIGMRVNRPLNVRSWVTVALAMPRMLAELSRKPECGMLGYSTWIAPPSVMVVQYWRSFELLERYARSRDEEHWPAWVAFNKNVGTNGDVGIWHETYRVEPGAYEALYANMPPFGLGAAGRLVTASEKRESAAGRMAASGDRV